LPRRRVVAPRRSRGKVPRCGRLRNLGRVALLRSERCHQHSDRAVREGPGRNAQVVLSDCGKVVARDVPPALTGWDEELRREWVAALEGRPRGLEQELNGI